MKMICPDKIVIRKLDGKFFKSGVPFDYNLGDMFRDLFSGEHNFYFTEIKEVNKKFWQRKRRFKLIDKTWETKDPESFDVENNI